MTSRVHRMIERSVRRSLERAPLAPGDQRRLGCRGPIPPSLAGAHPVAGDVIHTATGAATVIACTVSPSDGIRLTVEGVASA